MSKHRLVTNPMKSLLKPQIRDHIVSPDGCVLYPCQYCHKLFAFKEVRFGHMQTSCPSKAYILSVPKQVPDNNSTKRQSAPPKLQQQKSPPIKLKLQRASPQHDFSVSKIDWRKITQRLSDNSVSILTKEEYETFPCPLCDLPFKNKTAVGAHIRRAHQESGKVTMDPDELLKYRNTEDKSECPICQRKLSTRSNAIFYNHLETHSTVKNFTCDYCPQKFHRWSYKSKHMAKFHE